jgi:hypothetical protein
MLDYLQQFNSLPEEIRKQINSPETMKKIGELNDKYGVSLAGVIIRLVVKDPIVANLLEYAIREFKFDPTKADALVKEINQLLNQLIPSLVIPVQTGISGSTNQTLDHKRENFQAQNSSSMFSSADEKEINQFKKELASDGVVTLISKEEQLIEEILKRVNLDLASEFLADRLKQILKIYLRGVRDKMETGETLKKPWMQGGLNFDLPTVQKILKTADEIKSNASVNFLPPKPNRINLPEDLARPGKEIEYNLEKELAKGTIINPVKKDSSLRVSSPPSPSPSPERGANKFTSPNHPTIQPIKSTSPLLTRRGQGEVYLNGAKKVFFGGGAKKLDLSHELNSGEIKKILPEHTVQVRPAKKVVMTPKNIPSSFSKEPAWPVGRGLGVVTPAPISKVPLRPYGQTSGRPRMDDIKFTPKIMSQIEELRFVNTTTFRRLHPDPFIAANKIKEKINLLAEEYYGKRLEGIKAWRISPINSLYLAIGEASISQNKSIDAIMEERLSSGADYLTAPEFDAIMELNRELRY